MRNLLLFGHVVGAILLIGPATYASSTFARHAATGDRAAALVAHRTTRVYGLASIVVALLGVVLTLRSTGFGEVWIDTALTLFVVGVLLLLAGHVPAQRRAITAIEAGDPVSSSVLTRLRITAGLYAVVWVVIVWLMVAKPG
jgi:uncharacterized membrane protein